VIQALAGVGLSTISTTLLLACRFDDRKKSSQNGPDSIAITLAVWSVESGT